MQNGEQYTYILLQTDSSLRECVLNTLSSERSAEIVDASHTTDERGNVDTSSSSSCSVENGTGLSLYERVLDNARRTVYDSNIGRYVLRETCVMGAHIKEHLQYTEELKFVSAEKRRIVRDIIASQQLSQQTVHYHNNVNDIKFKLSRIMKEKRSTCACCQHTFPVSALPVVITSKQIERFIRSKSATCNNDSKRRDVKICLFCYQFFDDGRYVDTMGDNVNIQNEIEGELLSSPLRISNRSVSSEPLQRSALTERPLSALAVGAAMTQLRLKHDLVALDLRYQRIDGKGLRKGGMLDQNKFGRYLRDKYSDVSLSSLNSCRH